MTFDEKLAAWNARQAGPYKPKPNPRGRFGKPRLPQKEFTAVTNRLAKESKIRAARELSFPAPNSC